ncbi:N-acylneuraminate-9-phosphatase isoform X2 [Lycorma delicatula]|uniref:N-acylneuraminate-9-phosphatase isoform X2 n=1 Tax=Lycorma delicatula TaxID=130591 RepID=UPI003F5144E8
MIAELLSEKYSFPTTTSESVSQTFLENFCKCPDNPKIRMDNWHVSLWRNALPENYKFLAEEIYLAWISMRYKYLALDEKVIKMLKRLKGDCNYNLALITNGSPAAQWQKINVLNLSNYFDVILVSGDWPWEKPDVNIFFKACESLGVSPNNCVMVGDKIEVDIAGGIASGLAATFWVKLKYNYDSESYNCDIQPDYILDSVTELPSHLPLSVCTSALQSSILPCTDLYFTEGDSNNNSSTSDRS